MVMLQMIFQAAPCIAAFAIFRTRQVWRQLLVLLVLLLCDRHRPHARLLL